jgi:hypothetical protein
MQVVWRRGEEAEVHVLLSRLPRLVPEGLEDPQGASDDEKLHEREAHMTKTAKRVSRPKKPEPSTYVTINVPARCKIELDDIRHQISERLGFGISYSDAILYLINRHVLSEMEPKK